MRESLSKYIKVPPNEGLLQLEHVQATHRHCKKSGPSNLGFKVSQVRGMPTVFPLSSLAIEGLFSVRSMSVARLRQTHVVDLRRVHRFHGSFLWFQLCLHGTVSGVRKHHNILMKTAGKATPSFLRPSRSQMKCFFS